VSGTVKDTGKTNLDSSPSLKENSNRTFKEDEG
jgi:hypothetical protein